MGVHRGVVSSTGHIWLPVSLGCCPVVTHEATDQNRTPPPHTHTLPTLVYSALTVNVAGPQTQSQSALLKQSSPYGSNYTASPISFHTVRAAAAAGAVSGCSTAVNGAPAGNLWMAKMGKEWDLCF